MQTTTLSMFRFATLKDKLWAFSQMQFAHKPLQQIEGLAFYKLFGSGSGESFTPIPDFGVYAIMAAWSDEDHARERLEHETIFKKYRERASETMTLTLSPFHAWGRWDGVQPFEVNEDLKRAQFPEPVGILTRATIKKKSLLSFWKSVPEISTETATADGLLFKIGIGEIPWLHQVTFSVWRDRTSMMSFAYRNGCHAKAAKAAHEKQWFSEELFARFKIIDASGTWFGKPVGTLISKSEDARLETSEAH